MYKADSIKVALGIGNGPLFNDHSNKSLHCSGDAQITTATFIVLGIFVSLLVHKAS